MRRRGVGLLGMDTVLGPTGLAVRAGTWAQRDRWFLSADILRRPSAGKRPRETPAHERHPSVCAAGDKKLPEKLTEYAEEEKADDENMGLPED